MREEQDLPGKESPSSKASEMLIKVVDSGRTGTALAYVDQDMVPQDKAKRATSKRMDRRDDSNQRSLAQNGITQLQN